MFPKKVNFSIKVDGGGVACLLCQICYSCERREKIECDDIMKIHSIFAFNFFVMLAYQKIQRVLIWILFVFHTTTRHM